MSADALWWIERNIEKAPRARWFGIFRRPVKLSAYMALPQMQ